GGGGGGGGSRWRYNSGFFLTSRKPTAGGSVLSATRRLTASSNGFLSGRLTSADTLASDQVRASGVQSRSSTTSSSRGLSASWAASSARATGVCEPAFGASSARSLKGFALTACSTRSGGACGSASAASCCSDGG